MPDDDAPSGRRAGRGIPQRELRDPAELRALAHPVRLALLEHLVYLGSATATELAERLQDESPANCSWHLRQLARYGFIEEAGTGPGRQRRWRVVLEGTSFGPADEDSPELAHAVAAADEVLLDREVNALREWRASKRREPATWRSAALEATVWVWLTADEMAELRTEITGLLERHVYPRLERVDPARRPPGSRPARLATWMFPAGPETPAGDGYDDDEENG